MPFVQRNWKGEITGVFANSQSFATEELQENDPDLVSFLAAHPIPQEMLTVQSDADHLANHQAFVRIEKEHKLIAEGIVRFNRWFIELEVALSALLYTLINKPDSKIAYALYYSPTGFEARATLVGNALIQIASENERLKSLIETWERISNYIGKARQLRNVLAHGTPTTVTINQKPYARVTAPAFDVIRIGRPIDKGQVPGIPHHDIEQGLNRLLKLNESVDAINRLIAAFHEGDPSLSDKFAELELSLTRLRGP